MIRKYSFCNVPSVKARHAGVFQAKERMTKLDMGDFVPEHKLQHVLFVLRDHVQELPAHVHIAARMRKRVGHLGVQHEEPVLDVFSGDLPEQGCGRFLDAPQAQIRGLRGSIAGSGC